MSINVAALDRALAILRSRVDEAEDDYRTKEGEAKRALDAWRQTQAELDQLLKLSAELSCLVATGEIQA